MIPPKVLGTHSSVLHLPAYSNPQPSRTTCTTKNQQLSRFDCIQGTVTYLSATSRTLVRGTTAKPLLKLDWAGHSAGNQHAQDSSDDDLADTNDGDHDER